LICSGKALVGSESEDVQVALLRERRDQVNLAWPLGSRPHGMNSERERVTPWCYSIVAESVRDRLDKRLFRAASAFT